MSCSFLLQAKDGTLSFSQKGSTLWTRHEALARVSEVAVVPLPAPGHPAAPPPRPALSLRAHAKLNLLVLKVRRRVSSNARVVALRTAKTRTLIPAPPVQSQIGAASSDDRAALKRLQSRASHRTDGTRDLVGIRKQIVAATASGKLFALHSGDGRVLWHTNLHGAELPLIALLVARAPHKADEDIEARPLALMAV